jgi:hypothetical protein
MLRPPSPWVAWDLRAELDFCRTRRADALLELGDTRLYVEAFSSLLLPHCRI